MIRPVYAPFIEGQFGQAGSSLGMVAMANAARAAGITAELFFYEQLAAVGAALSAHLKAGDRLAVVCYSAGVGTGDYVSAHAPLDLLIALDPSRDCINYKVHPQTKTSILFHNNNWFAHLTGVGGAGEARDPGGDLGFQIRYEIDENHLLVDLDQKIHIIVQHELLRLRNGA